jgi:aminopeptidase N
MKKSIIIFQVVVALVAQNLWAQTKADTIHVSHYDINLEIRNFAKEELNGYTDITVEAKIAPLQNIYLHFMGLTVDSIKNGNNNVSFLHQGIQLKIDVSFDDIEQPKTIRVYYHGKPTKESFGGFHFTNDFAYNMGVAFYDIPHSYGRTWFPCIDEFTDKSTYTFNITTDADKKAVCGGMLTDSIPTGDAMLWTWKLTDPIPTYLASVAVGKYKVYKDTIQGIEKILPIEIYADSATLAKVPGSFVNLKTFIHTFEKRWGPCRWQRIGYVAVPFNSGAMEHATNIAYPKSSINGNTSSESLIFHELAHSWFGNLITCATSQNMWINEGFASFGEYLCYEALDPTLQTYNKKIRELHMKMLGSSICREYALDNVPTDETTYNSDLVYNKGALVAYTLRNYMGDELFFSSIKQFLDENKYGNVDSEEFFDKLSDISKMNLHDFYLGWVHQPGFLNFNIDSIQPIGGNKYKIAFKQRLFYANNFAKDNFVDVEFVSDKGERALKERICFSGESEIVEVTLPFEPAFWAIDPNFKMGDACYDYTETIKTTGTKSWGNANFSMKVNEIDGESIFRIEHNPFAPTDAKNSHPDIVKISEKHFWRTGFLQYNPMQTIYSFSYNSVSDGDLLKDYSYEYLVLLYRKDAAHDWQIIPAAIIGNKQQGKLETSALLSGEYTLGISDKIQVKEWGDGIEIYPNPVSNELQVTSNELQVTSIAIFDIYGRKQKIIINCQSSIDNSIDVSHLPSGSYILEIVSNSNKIYRKFIKL